MYIVIENIRINQMSFNGWMRVLFADVISINVKVSEIIFVSNHIPESSVFATVRNYCINKLFISKFIQCTYGCSCYIIIILEVLLLC
jgi:hypothetical protein